MEQITKLVELVEQLQEVKEVVGEGMSYKDSKEIRKVCQEIKNVAQGIRVEVNELRKK